MSDVRTMAHVEKFSHLTIPMLWFEIGLKELPERLEKRFSLYLNILPVVEQAALYGSLVLGALFSVFAVFQVALRTSKSMAAQRCHQKFNSNLANNSVYNPCEEKLIDLKSTKATNPPSQVIKVDEMSRLDDVLFEGDSLNVITRDQYELENDDALSDIDYNEENSEDSSSLSVVSVIIKWFFFYGRKTRFCVVKTWNKQSSWILASSNSSPTWTDKIWLIYQLKVPFATKNLSNWCWTKEICITCRIFGVRCHSGATQKKEAFFVRRVYSVATWCDLRLSWNLFCRK